MKLGLRCRERMLASVGEGRAEHLLLYNPSHFSRSHDAVIRVYDEAGNVTETHKHKGDFKEW